MGVPLLVVKMRPLVDPPRTWLSACSALLLSVLLQDTDEVRVEIQGPLALWCLSGSKGDLVVDQLQRLVHGKNGLSKVHV